MEIIGISRKQVDTAIKGNDWDLGNKVLYDLCKQHPSHRSKAEIIAKIWLIGRSYAAAIERRKETNNRKFEGDDYYLESVVPVVMNSDMDQWLKLLKHHITITDENLEAILTAHQKVTKLFSDVSGQNKRSLASKYLHFHYPHLFFIYDSRVVTALSLLSKITGRAKRVTFAGVDNDYRKVCEKCLRVREHVERKHKIFLTPRQLDNLLLEIVRQSRMGMRSIVRISSA